MKEMTTIDWILEEQAKGNIRNLKWSIDENGIAYNISFTKNTQNTNILFDETLSTYADNA